jgi:asparagine synthase (glutamine-hydrolysing)
MVSADRRYVIVFNGEIYNHRDLRRVLNPPGGWHGSSDSETLLESFRAWGPACLDRLNGMFAFAIWDRIERRLFAARDRLGVKPFFYRYDGRRFSFASRPAALLALGESSGLDIDHEALGIYLELGYVPAPLCMHRGVGKLKAGHSLIVSERGLRIVRYWDYRHIAPDLSLLGRSEDSLAQELDEVVRDAVRVRLMSDVPLGAFLSGGVDSALVVAGMKAVGATVPRTFTIAFDEPAFNEGPAAAAIAAHLGVDHVAEVLRVDSLLELLPDVVREFDEPLADVSAFPTMAVARLARRHVAVALTGDGGDELFGGYHYYGLASRLAGTADWPPLLRRLVVATIARLPSHRAKLLAGALRRQGAVALFQYLRSFGKDFAPVVSPGLRGRTTNAETWMAQVAASFALDLTPAEIGMRLDTAFTLADLYLQKVDVATMAFSLEARCPLTDYRLVEWAMRLPAAFKIRAGETKSLLKRTLCRYLPAHMVYQRKMGFSAPVAKWLRGPLREWARERLHDDNLMSQVPLDRRRVTALFDLHTCGARDAHPLLWSVLMLVCFVDEQRRAALQEPRKRAA